MATQRPASANRRVRIRIPDLHDAIREALHKRGFRARESGVIADYSTRATGEGHVEHGLGALWIMDTQGELYPGAGKIVCRRAGGLIRLVAPSRLGFLPAERAARELLRVKRSDVAAAVVVSRGFRGRLGHLVRPLAADGRIGLAVGSTPAVVAARKGGVQNVVGTNPMAIAVPVPGDSPIVADFATSEETYTQRRLRELCTPDSRGPICRSEPLRPWGGHRGWALAVAIQAAVASVAGIAPLPKGQWGLVLIVVPAHRLPGRSGWRAWLQLLGHHGIPGHHSEERLRRAYKEGVLVPGRLWDWVKDS